MNIGMVQYHMKIELSFTKKQINQISYYLGRKYNKSNIVVEKLIKLYLLDMLAQELKKDADEALQEI